MKHLAAYLLLGLGGNASPSASDIKEVLESVGIEADSERLDQLIKELEGKDINEVRPAAQHAPRFSDQHPLTLRS
jgi:large subunit ribosomal protein LP2